MLTGDVLRLTARRVPNRTAVVCGGERLDYRTLEEDANRFAHALHGAGLGAGDKLAIMAPNVARYPVVHFGAAKSGCVLVHLSVRYAVDELAYVLNKAEVELLVVEQGLVDLVVEARARLSRLRQVVVIGGRDGRLPDGLGFADFIAGQPAQPPALELREDDPFAMTYTGGTTGFPKGVLVDHRRRTLTLLQAGAEFGIDERDIVAVVTPLFHCVGLFVWYQPMVFQGATCVFLERWEPRQFVDMVEREGVTAAFLVPTQLNDLALLPDLDTARLASLAKVGFAGAPMPAAVMEALLELFPEVQFTEHYGQSETGPLTVKPPWRLRDKLASIGRPAIGIEALVVDAEGKPVAPGEVGEIVTRGDHLLCEYFDEPEQTAALYKSGDGWLWTGDLATVDEDGFLTLVDRSKDMIITGGENVYPAEIENALYGHEAIAECAAFGVPHERLGEVAAAAVVLKPGAEVSADELIEFCADRIARFKRPRRVDFMEALPKTAIGKVQRNLLREPFWRDRERRI
jgi:acyl-CoA synthetase (AMP-forming)/AMP-acid ligase II